MALIDLLLAPVSEAQRLRGRYDEARSLTLAECGSPFVVGLRAETHEITEVSGERDDPPPREPVPDRDGDDLPPREPAPDREEIWTFVERETDELSNSSRLTSAMRTDVSLNGSAQTATTGLS